MLAEELRDLGRRTLPDILILGGMFIFSFIAIVCLILALYMYLAASMDDRHAMLIVALLTSIIAIGFGIVISRSVFKERHQGEYKKPDENRDDQMEDIVRLGMEAEQLISKNAKNASIIALVAGIAFGASSEIRKSIMDLMK